MSNIVVADAAPLHYLILIDSATLLERLFERVLAPIAVRDELLHGNAPKVVQDWIRSPRPWLQFRPVAQPLAIADIHRGEAEALQLALEIKAAAVLIDDLDGRAAAKNLGLSTVGTIGILERASEKSLIDLPTALAALRSTSFFVSDEILDAALARARSRKGNSL